MLFGEKIVNTEKIIWDFDSQMEVQVMGSSSEQENYRNKSVYTFNLWDSALDQHSFKIIGLEHVKIIQYINLVVNRDYRVKTGKFSVQDIFIKNNWRQEYQICLSIHSVDLTQLPEIVKFLFATLQKVVSDLDINIVSGYYYLEDRKVGLKDKEFHLFFGQPKLEEGLEIQVSPQFKRPCHVWLSPHSFSRVNYGNSVLIYQKIWDLCQSMSGRFRYVLFGRDLYYPLKILETLENGVDFYGITHCPITYQDIVSDRDTDYSSKCHFVKKKDYRSTITDHLTGGVEGVVDEGEVEEKFVFVLTAGRNGLGSSMCQMLMEFRDRIQRIIYIGCSLSNMKKDFGYLLTQFRMKEVHISNEFSHTNFNNNVVVLE